MLRRIVRGHSHPQGVTIEFVCLHEMATQLAFLGRRRVYARIVALSHAQPGDRVLDVGCSGGYLARLLAAAVTSGGSVTGIDLSGPAVSYATRRAPGNCSVLVGAAQDLDLPDDSFDVVTSPLAVLHIRDADRRAAFSEMYRVTRPGGRLLVADFRPSGHRRGMHPGGHAIHHNHADLSDLATVAGFRVEERGDLPKLHYVRAVRPAAPSPADQAGRL
jgi:ubiquinone/menaquinone biosynthesis C-methylase UbiE